MSKTIVGTIFEVGDSLPDRNPLGIMLSISSEAGELAEEIAINAGLLTYKREGTDGILGEAVDVILGAIDLIHVKYPEMTEEEIHEVVKKKCLKWKKAVESAM